MTGSGQLAIELQHRLAAARPRLGAVDRFFLVEVRTAATVPLMTSGAPAGFPSPADDYMDRPLDFNELLIIHPAATFVVKVVGESMIEAGIWPGDLAIVDRALPVVDGVVILALLGNEFTIKRYRCKGPAVWLHAENPTFPDVVITEESGFEVWGVIKRCIRNL